MANQNPLIGFLQQQQQNPGVQTSQAFQQLMANPQVSGPYNARVNFMNATNADALNGIDNGPSNPINSMPVNPSGSASTLANNMVANNAMTNTMLYNLLSLASGETNNQNNNAVGGVNAEANQTNAQVGAANTGWTTDQNGNVTNNNGSTGGVSSGNPRIDTWTQAVMNGYKSINDVPGDIAPRVMQQLQANGYDAAKPVNTDIAGLTKLYGLGSNPISSANNPKQAAANGVGALLDMLTGGMYKTSADQQVKSYEEAANNFKSKYAGVLGKNVDLPTSSDTPQQAKEKFTKLMQQVQAIYYNGGSGPAKKPSLSSFNQ